MQILIAFYSKTGNTEKIANLILKSLKSLNLNANVFKIKPIVELPYLPWLLFSFIPNFPFPIKEMNIQNPDLLFFGLPKWTFNCPPATSFIRFLKKTFNGAKKPKIAIFMTYGGFAEERFLEKIIAKFKMNNFEVVAVEKFKRRDIFEHPEDINSKVEAFVNLSLEKFSQSTSR